MAFAAVFEKQARPPTQGELKKEQEELYQQQLISAQQALKNSSKKGYSIDYDDSINLVVLLDNSTGNIELFKFIIDSLNKNNNNVRIILRNKASLFMDQIRKNEIEFEKETAYNKKEHLTINNAHLKKLFKILLKANIGIPYIVYNSVEVHSKSVVSIVNDYITKYGYEKEKSLIQEKIGRNERLRQDQEEKRKKEEEKRKQEEEKRVYDERCKRLMAEENARLAQPQKPVSKKGFFRRFFGFGGKVSKNMKRKSYKQKYRNKKTKKYYK
jgi:hypothetical protein